MPKVDRRSDRFRSYRTSTMQILLTFAGAAIGWRLARADRGLFGALLGAFAAYAIAEVSALRSRIDALEQEFNELRRHLARRREEVERPVERSDTTEGPSAAPDDRQRDSWPPFTPNDVPDPALSASAPRAQTASEWPRETPALDSRASHGPPGPSAPAIFRIVLEYFTGGNALVRAGIIVLFFGVAFLLRYVAQHTQVPIQLRLSSVALGGIALLIVGWRLRARRPGYALALQGGGVGILYLTVFAALRLYSLFSPTVAFVLLVALAAFMAVLAVVQSSQAFAFLAVTGGFLAPLLASTGQGSHVVLFSYYAVLNAGILAIAWFKAWRSLTLAGFVFTFLIATAWGVLEYRPEFFVTTEPFLVLFFVFYVALAVLFATRQPPKLRDYVDATLVFGTPIVAFGLQSAMLQQRPFALACSALAVGAFYLALAWVLHRRQRESLRLLVEAFMALAVAFTTLAVPLAFNGRQSAATWALEGAALVWVGCRQGRRLPRAAGALLQIAGGLMLLRDIDAPHGDVPILNSAFMGGLMVSVASVFTAAIMDKHRGRLPEYERAFPAILFFWGLLWWLLTGLTEIDRHVPAPYGLSAALVFVTATALASGELYRRYQLSFARLPALSLLPALACFAAVAVWEVPHPFAEGGWIAWPLAFGGFYLICRRDEGEPGGWLANVLHVAAAWLLVALITWEAAWAIDRGVAGRGSWPAIAWALVPAVVLLMLPRLPDRIAWPLAAHREAYVAVAGGGFAVYLALWSVATNFTLPGDPYPLPYVPLLNWLDLAEVFVLLVLIRFWLHLRTARYTVYADVGETPIVVALAALAFIWLNAALLRTLHHWAGVPFEMEGMLRSTLVQTALSIFWAVLALTLMLLATRRSARVIWLTGAGLLIVVIAKLFLVDLSRVGTVERIISFVGVGLLMLVIGYFSPLPPAAARSRG